MDRFFHTQVVTICRIRIRDEKSGSGSSKKYPDLDQQHLSFVTRYHMTKPISAQVTYSSKRTLGKHHLDITK
jgi:hypothetical protein